MFNHQDRHYMSLALDEARAALAAGNYPVGAVLTVDGELIGRARNAILTESQSTAHAEHTLLRTQSALLRGLARTEPASTICLYTTLEPCLMCLGAAVLHRVTRIVVGCPDPHGGASGLNPVDIGLFYQAHWPRMEIGLCQEESVELIITFLKGKTFLSWEVMLDEFTKLRESW